MSRPPRVWVPDGIYHLTTRGNNRQAIFLDAVDYQRYLIELRRLQRVYPYRLLAYALMPNHVHMVLQVVPGGSPSDLMREVGTGYSRAFNDRHQRVGHLFQGRFYSNWVNRDDYLLEVTRYVHLNPVRAGLARDAVGYPWSSYAIYLGLRRDPIGLVEAETILRLFGSSPAEQRQQYRKFVDGLALQEQEMARLVRTLRHQKLIPPSRWLTSDSHLAKK